MISVTYLSTVSVEFDSQRLEELLAVSRANNGPAGLTGVLLYAAGSFIQTLEGPTDAVERTLETIEADPRHHGLFVTWREEIDAPVFGDWSMGFEVLSPAEAGGVSGFNDYLQGTPLAEGSEKLGRAEIFHRIFRDRMR